MILALCVVLGGALIGKSMSDCVRRRAASLRAITDGLKRLRVRMTGMFEPVQTALLRADSPLFSMLSEAMADGMSAGEAWERALPKSRRRGGPLDSLSDSDQQALSSLFAGLGQSGREEQDLLVGAAIRELETHLEGAQAKAREADRLYTTLGLLIGLMLALIVI